MPLPDLIEIVPLDKPVHAEITVPGSKSITNRALVLAALADDEVTLEGALWSEDTQVMVRCLQRLGFEVRVEPDASEFCNRTIAVRGRGGEIPNAGTPEKPLELFVGNAGTAARFLAAMVCLGRGVYRLSGVPRMHERPQAALFRALRELGYRVESEAGNEKLPATIHGRSSRGHVIPTEMESQRVLTSSVTVNERTRVSIEESSQFASALLLCAERAGWQVEVVGENAEESPYVAMTAEMIKVFPKNGGRFQIEPDASSGSYFLAVAQVGPRMRFNRVVTETDGRTWTPTIDEPVCAVSVARWPTSGWQIDERFSEWVSPAFFVPGGCLSRLEDLGDSIMTAIAVAPLAATQTMFTDLGRLRVQECERVVALRTELTRCGAKVVERDDTLEVFPSKLHGAEIETYNDHRMAMCFAVLGLKVPGVKIRNPACVKKTFPNFFQKLAAAPPRGLGVKILDGHTGRLLSPEELFAE